MKKFTAGFATGIVFYISVIPILESVTDLVTGWLETKKIPNIKKTIEGNNEIADLQERLEPVQSNVIGFEAPSEEDYYYDDDFEEDDYEDKKSVKKNKIGFI